LVRNCTRFRWDRRAASVSESGAVTFFALIWFRNV